MMVGHGRTSVLLLVLCSSLGLASQGEDPGAAEVRKFIASYVAAFNRGDAEALASHFSDQAEHVDEQGQITQGRTAIAADAAQQFAARPGLQLEVTVDAIRLLRPDVAAARGAAVVRDAEGRESAGRFTAIYVKRAGEWLIDSVQESVPTPAPAPSNYEHLRELEWMIGEWVDQGQGSSVRTQCAWTANRNFITRSFTLAMADQVQLSGTQVIGWDPKQQRIRSWVFDSEGGFGEGVWVRDADRWTIQATGTYLGGQQSSAVNIIERIDDNTFTWQSTSRELDGETLPNIEKVTVVRQPSTP